MQFFGFLSDYFHSTLEVIVFAVFVGVSAAILIGTYQKRVYGELVRRLLEKGADTAENAMTLADVGLEKRRFLRFGLRRRTSSVRAVALCAEELTAAPILDRKGKDTGKRKLPPVTEQHFYVPEEKQLRAKSQYGEKARWGFAVLAIVLCAAMALLAHFFADELVTMAKNFYNHYFAKNPMP